MDIEGEFRVVGSRDRWGPLRRWASEMLVKYGTMAVQFGLALVVALISKALFHFLVGY